MPLTRPLHLEYVETAAQHVDQRRAVLDLCRVAYDEDITAYLSDIGPGLHALGEPVATHPDAQRRGYGSAVLQALAGRMEGHDIGALSPSDERFYARLGWELWRGPLAVRTDHGVVPSPPDEQVMVRRLPRTPVTIDLDLPLSVEWRPGDVW